MRLQDDDGICIDQPVVAKDGELKKGKIVYAASFLLSLRDLEVCKQLPSGLDKSVLSEFHDAFHGSQDKAKIPPGFAMQNSKHAEYSASPPTRRDANSYPRGSAGKWETRSRDSDSLSDRDSESGRQIGTHARRPWQNSEHDGLLGSGSSPKLTGYTSGTSVPKFRTNDQNHLNRSNAPYQPPRPYKPVPHNRSTTSDLHNDETFGSAEMTSEDQAEEERKRRAEFELMRKGRTKPSHNKQHSSLVSSKDDLVYDTTEFQGNQNNENNILSETTESHVPPTILGPCSSSKKSSSSLQTPAARPVVPPGFTKTNGVGKLAIKHETKVQTPEVNCHPVHVTHNSSIEEIMSNKTIEQPDDQSRLNIQSHVGDFDILGNGKGLDSSKGTMQHNTIVSSQNIMTPLLEDIFGSSLIMDGEGLSISMERIDDNRHDKWKGSNAELSKFAHWFTENKGKGSGDGGLTEKPVDLFSLIGGAPTSTLDAKADKSPDTSVPVLTCEDLEQSILSEVSHHKIPLETPPQGSVICDLYEAQPKSGIDALATQHLLTVLQKGHGQNDIVPSHNISKGFTNIDIATHGSKQQKADKASDVGKNPTLEAIFGSAFMKELQASDAPVSTKRDTFVGDSSRYPMHEYDILTTGNDRLNLSNSFHEFVDDVNNPGNAHSILPSGNPDKLDSLSAMFRDGRSVRQSQDSHVFPRNSSDTVDFNSMFQNIQLHSSPPLLPSHHVGQRMPFFNQQDARQPLPHMRFPDNMVRHDSQASHQFPPNHQMFNHPRPMGFAPPSQDLMMQQLHLQGSGAPSHLTRQYPGNAPRLLNPYSQVLGFRQELDPLHGSRIGRQQPGYHGIGMPTQVPDSGLGNNHTEVLQRLMEMERRSNQKPSHPSAGQLGQLPNF